MKDRDLSEQFANIERLMLRVGWLEQRRFARDLEDFGLTVPQFTVLRCIVHQSRRLTMSALADETLLRCATMTGIVDRLAKTGLVTRKRDPSDRRRVLVELTAAGHDLLGRVRVSRARRLRQTLSHLSPDEASELLRLLKLYLQAFREQLEQEPGE